MKREEFLERVRKAAEVGRAYRVHATRSTTQVGYIGHADGACDALASEVKFVGGEPAIVSTREEAQTLIQELLQKYRVKSAVVWQHPMLNNVDVNSLLQRQGAMGYSHAELVDKTREEQRAIVLHADIGITSCDVAVAETGTLVVCSGPGRERMFSLVPPVHVAIVGASQIVPDLIDVFRRIQGDPGTVRPSNIAFISGPSKTGDIELELTTGVHGPGKWHVIVVRSE